MAKAGIGALSVVQAFGVVPVDPFSEFRIGYGSPTVAHTKLSLARASGLNSELLPSFEELLGPAVIQALRYALSPTQLGNAVFALQAVQHDPDLLFR